MLDLQAETEACDEAGIRQLQAMKTGALIQFATEAGAVLGGAVTDERERLAAFGAVCGELFQLVDDMLDVTSDVETMGKKTSKDAGRGKATLVSLLGLEAAEGRVRDLTDQANGLLDPFGSKADMLRQAVAFLASRKR